METSIFIALSGALTNRQILRNTAMVHITYQKTPLYTEQHATLTRWQIHINSINILQIFPRRKFTTQYMVVKHSLALHVKQRHKIQHLRDYETKKIAQL